VVEQELADRRLDLPAGERDELASAERVDEPDAAVRLDLLHAHPDLERPVLHGEDFPVVAIARGDVRLRGERDEVERGLAVNAMLRPYLGPPLLERVRDLWDPQVFPRLGRRGVRLRVRVRLEVGAGPVSPVGDIRLEEGPLDGGQVVRVLMIRFGGGA
jgi:hypothetical protein